LERPAAGNRDAEQRARIKVRELRIVREAVIRGRVGHDQRFTDALGVSEHRHRYGGVVFGVADDKGAAKLLARLDAAPWAIVTSAPRALPVARRRAARLPQPCVLVSAEAVERGKPDPQGYALAAARLAAATGRCIVFEDAPAGIVAARAAGMRVVALTTTHTAEQHRHASSELEQIVPDLRGFLQTPPR